MQLNDLETTLFGLWLKNTRVMFVNAEDQCHFISASVFFKNGRIIVNLKMRDDRAISSSILSGCDEIPIQVEVEILNFHSEKVGRLHVNLVQGSATVASQNAYYINSVAAEINTIWVSRELNSASS